MNFQTIVSELLRSGLKQHEIGRLIGVSQSHVSQILNGERGKRLSFSVGCRLLKVHRERVGNTVLDGPVTGSRLRTEVTKA